MGFLDVFGRIDNRDMLVDQLIDHKGLAEIYVHVGGAGFLFLSALLAIFVIWLNFGRQGQGWFALRMGIFFIGLIGLGEAAEHFFAPQGHDFFHYLHMLAAPVSLFYLYLAINELQLLYFEHEPKRMVNDVNLYLIGLAAIALAAVLGYQAKANWDISVEFPFLSITVVPTMVMAYLLIRRSIDLYRAQHRVPLFSLSIFSTSLALIPLLTWGAVVLAVAIWLGRAADFAGSPAAYTIFHTIQDLFHAGVGAALMGSSLMLILTRDTKATEDRLIQSAKLVSLGEMTTNLATDINNPLMAIIGYSTLMLEDKKIPAPRRKDLEMIQQEASKAARVTKDLLDYAGKRRPRFQVIDVEVPLDESLSLMESRLRQAGIAVVKSMQRPLPFISADPDQLKQAFVNIMNNAIDAMPRGGRLEIFVLREDDENQLEISFNDSGNGIPEEMLTRIFEPFFSLKLVGGTGLGLSLAQSVIKQHRGSIDVASQAGIGTSFTIKLPAVPDDESHWYGESGYDTISQTQRII